MAQMLQTFLDERLALDALNAELQARKATIEDTLLDKKIDIMELNLQIRENERKRDLLLQKIAEITLELYGRPNHEPVAARLPSLFL